MQRVRVVSGFAWRCPLMNTWGWADENVAERYAGKIEKVRRRLGDFRKNGRC